MRIKFLGQDCPGRKAAEDHIHRVYKDVYGATVTEFAPLLVAASRPGGEILCAAGIRTQAHGFFSDTYLNGNFSKVLRAQTGHKIDQNEIMEVVSLASTTPFPVLPMFDSMLNWGRANGMTCGVFTATAPLRKLLKRTGLSYAPLCAANPARLANAGDWGRYYDSDPWVCAVSETHFKQPVLSPRARNALKIS
jgi:hypothetical protein